MIVQRITCALGSTVAIVAVPIVCVTLWWVGVDENLITFVLSVLALSFSQLVLRSGDRDTRAIQAKLDGLVEVSDAPDDLVGIERN